MTNPWRDFLELLPRTPLTVAQVVTVNGDGTSVVQFPNGSQLKVRGDSVAALDYAYIKDGEIRGQAPAVVPVVLEV